MTTFLSELEQEPFDGEEFVERLAWRATGGKFEGELFDAHLLHDAFDSGIRDLKAIYDSHQKKCERLEMVCREEEKKHWMKVAEMQERCKHSFVNFEQLDGRLDAVAAKVVYLGDQLEGVNTPRARAVEAQKLMTNFAQFLNTTNLNWIEPIHDITQLYEEADVIQKLHLISQELPNGAKFNKARQNIALKYDQIEKELIEEFVRAHKTDDKSRMKEIAAILSHFKGYSQCIDAFIEQSQTGIFLGLNIFTDIVPLCAKNQQVIQEVFTNPEQVMSKFVLNIFHGKLQEYVQNRLNIERNESDNYLMELYELYAKTCKLSNQLSSSKTLGCEPSFLSKMTRNIFSRYLDSYISVETSSLKYKCVSVLQKYYDSKNHQKKPIPSGSIQELKRDLQAKIGRANINIGTLANINISVSANENYSSETFLSEEIAISILQDIKLALQRCHILSKPQDLPSNALNIFDLQLQYLCVEHIDYAIEIALQSIPSSEPKNQPEIYFFDIVRQCNAICHLIEKQFVDSVIPLVISTPKHGECLKKKRDLSEQLEIKLNNGLEKSLSSIIGWVKLLLQSEQKKNDFKPETEDLVLATTTAACSKVVRFIKQYIGKIRDSLDGKNVEAMLTELGIRTHRVIFEHLQQFQFSSVGAMVVICDVNEYRRCANEFGIPLLTQLFDVLHALCNLLIVAPENLKQVCSGDQLVGLDRSILINFVQLRADYKSAKIVNQFK